MKLRYQMRGLGIGIIVTALLMGVALDDGKPLTDAEIKLLAAELGMVESDSLKLSDVQTSTTKPVVEATEAPATEPTTIPTEEPGTESATEPTETPTAEPTMEPIAEPSTAPTAEPTEAPTAEPSVAPTTEPTAEPTEEPTQAPAAGEIITIVVKRGATSYSVSKQLAEAGLVENANSFDKYLCSNGYAERIQVGTFEIPMGNTEEQIAKIITKTR